VEKGRREMARKLWGGSRDDCMRRKMGRNVLETNRVIMSKERRGAAEEKMGMS